MINNKLVELINMSKDQLIKELEKFNYNVKELDAFSKGKELLDKLNELNNSESIEKVSLSLIAYTLYKMKGGK